jgi:hypothetical protein
MWDRDISVCVAMDYELDGRGSIHGRGKRFVYSPHRPHRLWGPPSLLSSGYRSYFPGGKADVV